jgi:hypothetical protein
LRGFICLTFFAFKHIFTISFYIINKKICKVIIGCTDPFVQVAGKGIEKLRAAGTVVTTGVLENECKELNKRFFTFHFYRSSNRIITKNTMWFWN